MRRRRGYGALFMAVFECGCSCKAGPELCLDPDGVHMSERGNELLAQAGAGAVMGECPTSNEPGER